MESKKAFNPKFLIGGFLILAAVVYLISSSTNASAEYFLTIDELTEKGTSMVNKNVRVSGAVLGESITYDANNLRLEFKVAHVTGDNGEIERMGGLANVLHQATIDPSRNTLIVVYEGVRPDLLRNEAQAIMTGQLGSDGIFYADELLLKCPTKYEEAVPEQAEG